MEFSVKVVGLGEGGARAVNKMISSGVGAGKVEFVTIGNDENILLASSARKNIFLNRDQATVYKNTAEALHGAKIIFLVAGLGSSAARAAVPLVTSCAKNLKAVTVAFVCRPFILEDVTRKMNAEYTLTNLRENVDTLFAMPVEKFFLFRPNQSQISLNELLDIANEIFCRGVEIFLDMVAKSDSSLVLLKWGNAAFGYGEGTSAFTAIQSAAKFPTLNDDDLKHAEGVLVRFVSEKILPLASVEAANNFIKKQLQPDAEFFSQEEKKPAFGEKVFASIIMTRKGV